MYGCDLYKPSGDSSSANDILPNIVTWSSYKHQDHAIHRDIHIRNNNVWWIVKIISILNLKDIAIIVIIDKQSIVVSNLSPDAKRYIHIRNNKVCWIVKIIIILNWKIYCYHRDHRQSIILSNYSPGANLSVGYAAAHLGGDLQIGHHDVLTGVLPSWCARSGFSDNIIR